jgi:hypothetical protein
VSCATTPGPDVTGCVRFGRAASIEQWSDVACLVSTRLYQEMEMPTHPANLHRPERSPQAHDEGASPDSSRVTL